jgi:hypothetical protein
MIHVLISILQFFLDYHFQILKMITPIYHKIPLIFHLLFIRTQLVNCLKYSFLIHFNIILYPLPIIYNILLLDIDYLTSFIKSLYN